jgi:hypothetical protein
MNICKLYKILSHWAEDNITWTNQRIGLMANIVKLFCQFTLVKCGILFCLLVWAT